MDKRNYVNYYFSLLRRKQLLIFTFYTYNDYNSRTIKICLFFVQISLFFTVNTLFFNDSNMHEIYVDQGEFNFIYQLPNIFYSSIICNYINYIISYLSLTETNIIKLKMKNEKINESKSQMIKCLKIKFFLFFLFSFFLLVLFWYYISCFCAVYKNTQIYLFKDTSISFILSLLYPIGFSLLPGIFRIPALRAPKKDKECLYKFSNFLEYI